jgi:hypothetical protein
VVALAEELRVTRRPLEAVQKSFQKAARHHRRLMAVMQIYT